MEGNHKEERGEEKVEGGKEDIKARVSIVRKLDTKLRNAPSLRSWLE